MRRGQVTGENKLTGIGRKIYLYHAFLSEIIDEIYSADSYMEEGEFVDD